MRPIDKSLYTTNQVQYNPYGDAKPDLMAAIGNFCSFCEREGFSSSLDVEHVEHKNNNRPKMLLWDNFLLACKNCNSIKGTKPINFQSILLPYLNDTFSVFEYLESGLIKIKDNVDVINRPKVEELVDLIGLDRRPGHRKYSTKDHRWKERKQAWDLATRYNIKYVENRCDIETIIDLSLKTGFWSIWMSVFEGFSDVQRQLINSFLGTSQAYFAHI